MSRPVAYVRAAGPSATEMRKILRLEAAAHWCHVSFPEPAQGPGHVCDWPRPGASAPGRACRSDSAASSARGRQRRPSRDRRRQRAARALCLLVCSHTAPRAACRRHAAACFADPARERSPAGGFYIADALPPGRQRPRRAYGASPRSRMIRRAPRVCARPQVPRLRTSPFGRPGTHTTPASPRDAITCSHALLRRGSRPTRPPASASCRSPPQKPCSCTSGSATARPAAPFQAAARRGTVPVCAHNSLSLSPRASSDGSRH